MQGYYAQLVTNENQIVIAAEITVDSPDFGRLEPMVKAAERELTAAGVRGTPSVALADAGYWHTEQMQSNINRGTQVLIPPNRPSAKAARPGWQGGLYDHIRQVLDTDYGDGLYRTRQGMIESVFAQTKCNRGMGRFRRRGRPKARRQLRPPDPVAR